MKDGKGVSVYPVNHRHHTASMTTKTQPTCTYLYLSASVHHLSHSLISLTRPPHPTSTFIARSNPLSQIQPTLSHPIQYPTLSYLTPHPLHHPHRQPRNSTPFPTLGQPHTLSSRRYAPAQHLSPSRLLTTPVAAPRTAPHRTAPRHARVFHGRRI